MIKGYIEKEKLYKLVDEKLAELGITEESYPLDSCAIARSIGPSLIIEQHKFPTNKMGGILYKGEVVSTLALNTLRSDKGKNFDCMHEPMHFWLHPPGMMLCIDNNYILQNSGIEWQANEGAAQALMPVRLFIKKYMELKGNTSALSNFFRVGERSIEYRIRNLKLSHYDHKKNSTYSKVKSIICSCTPESNAAYCPKCGYKTSLNINDIFSDWFVESEEALPF